MRTFVFNRRVVDDQTIYVRAASRKEAWAKARRDDAHDTGDARVKKATYRFLNEETSTDTALTENRKGGLSVWT